MQHLIALVSDRECERLSLQVHLGINGGRHKTRSEEGRDG
jgi:hypothetical protein